MGFPADFTVYLWNWVIWAGEVGAIIGCWQVGAWGLLFDDDFGYMTNNCYKMMGSWKVEFPVQYESPFWETEINFDA